MEDRVVVEVPGIDVVEEILRGRSAPPCRRARSVKLPSEVSKRIMGDLCAKAGGRNSERSAARLSRQPWRSVAASLGAALVAGEVAERGHVRRSPLRRTARAPPRPARSPCSTISQPAAQQVAGARRRSRRAAPRDPSAPGIERRVGLVTAHATLDARIAVGDVRRIARDQRRNALRRARLVPVARPKRVLPRPEPRGVRVASSTAAGETSMPSTRQRWTLVRDRERDRAAAGREIEHAPSTHLAPGARARARPRARSPGRGISTSRRHRERQRPELLLAQDVGDRLSDARAA